MENPETPKRRGWSSWSFVRKAQIIVGATGAFVTIIGTIPLPFLDNLPPHSAASDFLFDVGMFLTTPTVIVSDLLGMGQSGPQVNVWAGFVIVVLVNTFLCLLIGTFISWLLYFFVLKNGK